MRMPHWLRIAPLLGAMLFLSSCSIQQYIDGTANPEALPPDLGKDDAYMMVQLEGRNSHDRYLRKHFKRNYRGNHLFVDNEELNTPRYADAERYRYVFFVNIIKFGYGSGGGASYTYFVYDRVTKKTHTPRISGSWFAAYIKGYVINLEKQRAKNASIGSGKVLE